MSPERKKEIIDILARSLKAGVESQSGFTGKVTVTVNYHQGTPASAVVTLEEGMKL